jgi:hypothetical protein
MSKPPHRSTAHPRFPGPVVRLPAGRFVPPHCPNQDCRFYEPDPVWTYTLWGRYHAPSCRKPIPRYQCTECRRTFTARTFSATYWLHRYELFALISQAAVAGSGIRPIARTLGISHSTVARHLTRAGRNCLVFHRQLLKKTPRSEPVIFDGFETFEYSQFFPCHYNLAVGRESWMIYHFTDSPLRRKGAMTARQKERRSVLETKLGRPDPKAVENGICELLREVLKAVPPGTDPSSSRPLFFLLSDEHPAYVRAVRRLRKELHQASMDADERTRGEKGTAAAPVVTSAPTPALTPTATPAPTLPPLLRHRRTPSTDPRTRANDLFPVNLADLLLRHSSADHRRETIAFDKRRQGGLERLAIFTVWRNTIKWQRENQPGETAAMRAGLVTRRLRWGEIFARRRFPRAAELPGCWWEYYWRRVKTAALGEHQTESVARFAF